MMSDREMNAVGILFLALVAMLFLCAVGLQ